MDYFTFESVNRGILYNLLAFSIFLIPDSDVNISTK